MNVWKEKVLAAGSGSATPTPVDDTSAIVGPPENIEPGETAEVKVEGDEDAMEEA